MDKQLPHNLDSERIVLGSIMTNINAYSEVSVVMNSDMFYDAFHKEIYEEAKKLVDKGKAPDIVLLSQAFKGDHERLMKLVDISSCYSIDYYDHALNIQEKYVRRKLWLIGQQMASDIFSSKETTDILYGVQNELTEITGDVTSNEVDTLEDAIKSVYKQIENNLRGERLTGTDTGFRAINKASGGLQKSDLIIIAGETSNGKSSLALSMVDTATKSGEAVAIYSMEMKKEQLTARLMSMNSGISSSDILYTKLNEYQLEILDCSVGRINHLPIYFDDNSTSNVDKIIASIRSMKTKFDISGAVVDYLQILNVNMRQSNKEQAMGDVARRLKNLAKELDIWIIAISQLNRDSNGGAPNLNRLRDSGQIAEAADMVLLVYRPEINNRYYPEPYVNTPTKGTAMIDVAKGRNVGTFKFICKFDAERTHFKDISESELYSIEVDEQPF